MFISKRELDYLKETIKHLDRRLDNERDLRYRLEAQFDMLLDHLKLEIATLPTTPVIREKSK
jgi:predicted RNase H-like nuclease (RuvC/YqgF family)